MRRAWLVAVGGACAAVVGSAAASVRRVAAHGGRPGDRLSDEEQFAAFMQDHAREYERGSEEYVRRLRAFRESVAAVEAHNARPGRFWTAGVNALADRTPDELAALRGYIHGARAEGGGDHGPVRRVSTETQTVDTSTLPKDWSWQNLQAMKDVKDQGRCGSCWAVSSATVLRAHAELYQTDRTFSVQQILDCAPNPRECGGTGGCKGATAELAMDYVMKAGSVTEEERKYAGRTMSCPSDMALNEQTTSESCSASIDIIVPKSDDLTFVAINGAKEIIQLIRHGDCVLRSIKRALRAAASFFEVSSHNGGGAKFGMVGWTKLPENKAEPLMLAVYERGPVVVAVGTNAAWHVYRSGVLDACDKDSIINHAVALTGYGEDHRQDGPKKYWRIQNSWGPRWGEQGFIRLERKDAREEDAYCGWDARPEKGGGCKGGPSKVRVCGSCGVLYDSVVPRFVLGEHGLLKQARLLNSTA